MVELENDFWHGHRLLRERLREPAPGRIPPDRAVPFAHFGVYLGSNRGRGQTPQT